MSELTQEVKESAKAKTETNGVVKILLPKRGRIKFQFNDDDQPFELDVVQTYDEWNEVNWRHRDKDGELPREKWAENAKEQHEFVQALVNDAYAKIKDAATPNLSRAESQAFISYLIQEVKKLRDFFSPKEEKASSSPENSGAARPINFSQ